MWKEARGEQKELRSTSHNTTCANLETDSCRPSVRVEGPLGTERMEQRASKKNCVLIIFKKTAGEGCRPFNVNPTLSW